MSEEQKEKLSTIQFVLLAIKTLSGKHAGLHLRLNSKHRLKRAYESYFGKAYDDSIITSLKERGDIETIDTPIGVTLYIPGTVPVTGTAAVLDAMGLGHCAS